VVFSPQFLQHVREINPLTESALEHFPRMIDAIKLAGTSIIMMM
jgi:hypothetical protein